MLPIEIEYNTMTARPAEAGPTYDYVYNWGTGQYEEMYGSGSVSQNDWSSSTLAQMGYRGRSASSILDAYEKTGSYKTEVYGTDCLGNQEVWITTLSTDHMSVHKLAFWQITGSYYNELYYFSGLVAFDTYAALNNVSSDKGPIIPGIYDTSWKNLVYQVRNLEDNLKYGRAGSKRRRTGQAPALIRGIANINPVMGLMS